MLRRVCLRSLRLLLHRMAHVVLYTDLLQLSSREVPVLKARSHTMVYALSIADGAIQLRRRVFAGERFLALVGEAFMRRTTDSLVTGLLVPAAKEAVWAFLAQCSWPSRSSL